MRTQIRRASPVARSALMILAGWETSNPSHHSLEAEAAEMQDVSERDNAARVTFAKAARNIAVAALLLVGVATTAPASADQAVSPAMQTLISQFIGASIRQYAADVSGDSDAISIVSQDRAKALTALVFHEPVNLAELSAKTAALIEFSEDVERFALRALVQDMNRLVEVK